VPGIITLMYFFQFTNVRLAAGSLKWLAKATAHVFVEMFLIPLWHFKKAPAAGPDLFAGPFIMFVQGAIRPFLLDFYSMKRFLIKPIFGR
jgi:hypothetical protein